MCEYTNRQLERILGINHERNRARTRNSSMRKIQAIFPIHLLNTFYDIITADYTWNLRSPYEDALLNLRIFKTMKTMLKITEVDDQKRS